MPLQYLARVGPKEMVVSGDEMIPTGDGPVIAQHSVVSYLLGGRWYPKETKQGCKVCHAHRREAIEHAILKGHAYKSIVEAAVNAGDVFSLSSLNRHVKHMPHQATIIRTLLDQRQDEIGLLLDDIEGSIVDHIGALRAVQQRGFERMADGEIQPEMADLLAAAKALAQLQVAQGDVQLDRMLYLQVIQEILSTVQNWVPEQFDQIVDSMSGNPILRAADQRLRSRSLGEPEGD